MFSNFLPNSALALATTALDDAKRSKYESGKILKTEIRYVATVDSYIDLLCCKLVISSTAKSTATATVTASA